MSAVKITREEVSVGMVIPWSLYNDLGSLLLQRGCLITSEHQLGILLGHGMYRNDAAQEELPPRDESPITEKSDPFRRFDDLAKRITEIFSRILRKEAITYDQLQDFSQDFQNLCEQDSDAALGAVHLCHHFPYTICHPLHSAILSELIAKRIGYDPDKRIQIITAALTANLGMLDLQEILHHQTTPLTEDQKVCIQGHPDESIRILTAAGIHDSQLEQIIKQHHERINKSGYPNNLERSMIVEGAQIISIADRYSAMVSSRGYRKSLTSRDAMREFFLQKNRQFDERLTLTFIEELGVFPPGTYVSLGNGEKAIVIKRGSEAMWPIVSSILQADGVIYAQPIKRDSNEEMYSIRDIVTTDQPLSLKLPSLWGYD